MMVAVFDMSSNALRNQAEKMAAKRLEALCGKSVFREVPLGYTRHPEQNLVPGIEVIDFWQDLGEGAGNELIDGVRDPAKFCAAFSSSALAVNTFGPFRHKPYNLDLIDLQGFSEAQFEKPLPTGLRGTNPHLDFYIAGPTGLVCVESKFLEPLWPKRAKFADSYKKAIESLAEPMWASVYMKLKRDPLRFNYLDAAQLVKHYLGMRNTLGGVKSSQTLLYVYWEPDNSDDIEVYCDHRTEVGDFTKLVSGGKIEFVARSYRQLWNEWSISSNWEGMAAHLSNLERRYSFSI